jgi:hypothetical protein
MLDCCRGRHRLGLCSAIALPQSERQWLKEASLGCVRGLDDCSERAKRWRETKVERYSYLLLLRGRLLKYARGPDAEVSKVSADAWHTTTTPCPMQLALARDQTDYFHEHRRHLRMAGKRASLQHQQLSPAHSIGGNEHYHGPPILDRPTLPSAGRRCRPLLSAGRDSRANNIIYPRHNDRSYRTIHPLESLPLELAMAQYRHPPALRPPFSVRQELHSFCAHHLPQLEQAHQEE